MLAVGRSKEVVHRGLDRIPTDGRLASLGIDDAILDRLRSWRSGEAKRHGVPAYVVFHDTTPESLAPRGPVPSTASGP